MPTHVPFSGLLLSNANSCASQWPGQFHLAELFADGCFINKIMLNLLILDRPDFRIYHTTLDKLEQLGFSH